MTSLSMSLRVLAKLTAGFALWASGHGALGSSIPFPGDGVCPGTCAGNDPQNWTTYSSVDRLRFCNETMLLDFAVMTPLGDSTKQKTIRACTPRANSSASTNKNSQARKKRDNRDATTNETATADVQIAWYGLGNPVVDLTGLPTMITTVHDYLETASGTSLLFAVQGNQAVGVFAGALVRDAVLDSATFQSFVTRVATDGVSEGLLMQVCGPDLPGDFTFGIVAAVGDSKLELAQAAVASWLNGSCATAGISGTASLGNITLPIAPPTKTVSERSPSRVQARAACKTLKVKSGDTCTTLAKTCGVTLAQFQTYNPGSTFCSSLQPDQPVCCGSGTLPTPTPGADGSCASYLVVSGDWCAKIAASNAVAITSLETWNKKTWGWTGCNNLQAGVNMCLSSGNPPMPAPVTNALCGPQVPGTAKPASGTDLSTLNQCPLNACCDIWGQCGTTTEFCTKSSGDSGAPGTAQPGQNGCISNCGTDIISGTAPAQFRKVAYFEGWNPSRPCLQMDVDEIDASRYTHIHFGFAEITRDTWQPSIPNDTQSQFARFVALQTPMKKVLSFGGWTFSTATYDFDIFRTAMLAVNRNTLADNVAKFITANNLDGVDFDWEYPGAPDIPGIPPGSPTDGTNYLAFLKVLKGKLPNKSVSIAAPASYWYLKGFPIKQMATILDYIVFMTYDLHGQWDFGNQWATPGCPSGNCLRSHINITETLNALSMITKAGVPSNMILVGVSSYGRSFQMATPGCTGPMCTYSGPDSNAMKGPCTDTAGYISNAEINTLIGVNNPGLQSYADADSDSDVLVYNSNNWVAYMSETRKDARMAKYQSLKMGGISDWAVDLQKGERPLVALPDKNEGYIDPILKGCNTTEAKIVREAWEEGSMLMKMQYEWSPRKKWQNAFDMYLGEGTQKDNTFWGNKGPIRTIIQNNHFVHNGGLHDGAPKSDYIWIYCHEKDREAKNKGPANNCIDPKDPTKLVNAYTWDRPGWFWSGHYIVLCDRFYTAMPSLAEQTKKAKGDSKFQLNMDNWKKIRSRSLLHETYHMAPLVSKNGLEDIDYTPFDIAQTARKKGTSEASRNCESYVLPAMAIYVMKTFNQKTPPTPAGLKWPPIIGRRDDGPGGDPGDNDMSEEVDLGTPPDNWDPPVDDNSPTFTWSAVDNPDAVALSTYGPLEYDLDAECHQGEQYWDLSQCQTFCNRDPATCNQITDGGDTYYQCDCGGTDGECVNGQYDNIWACQLSCDSNTYGGTCTVTEGEMGATCSGCNKVNVCKAGEYDDFDACSASCFEGECNENAGQPKIVCVCPS